MFNHIIKYIIQIAISKILNKYAKIQSTKYYAQLIIIMQNNKHKY